MPHEPNPGRPAEIQKQYSREDIAALAYAFWAERGCPLGSPEQDWFRAEEELRKRKRLPNALRELAERAQPPRDRVD